MQLISKCFLSVALVFQLTLNAHTEQLVTTDSIYEQVLHSVKFVQDAIYKILSTPRDQQTFDNTLGAWYDIHKEICSSSMALNEQMKSDFPDKAQAVELIQEYQSFIQSNYSDHEELYSQLFFYAKNTLIDNDLQTPVQREIASLIGANCEQFKAKMSCEDQEVLASLIMTSCPFFQGESKILPIKSRRDRDDSGYSVEGRISRKWGGKDNESKWEGSVNGEVHDGRGNYAEGEVKHNDKGEGRAEVRGGHESKKN